MEKDRSIMGTDYRITVPKPVRAVIGLNKGGLTIGDFVEFVRDDKTGNMIIRKEEKDDVTK